MKKKKKNKRKQKVMDDDPDADAEDWCFMCKDGGNLLLCDNVGCVKVYHPNCVGRKSSTLKNREPWICSRHSCFLCSGPPEIQCFCCPFAVCEQCVKDVKFALIKGRRGLCHECLELALLVEQNAKFNSDGDEIDLEDRNTYECRYKEYLEIIMEQEGFSFENINTAAAQLKKDKKQKGVLVLDSIKIVKGEDHDELIIIDCDVDDAVEDNPLGKRKMSDVDFVNLVQSEEDANAVEDDNSWGIEYESIMPASKKQRTLNSERIRNSPDKKVDYRVQESCFAAIVVDNIKLVYLRKGLVEKLMMQPENFEDKVVGCFVKVKRDCGDCSHTSSHQLLQVTGVKKISVNETNSEILLQVSNMRTDINISMLSDDDIFEDECEDLHQKVKEGLIIKPTVVELEDKARSLHEDITKHWVEIELVRLQKWIEFVNEKGWRRDAECRCAHDDEYLDQRELLKKEQEQQRLLQLLPKVTAEVVELEPTFVDSKVEA